MPDNFRLGVLCALLLLLLVLNAVMRELAHVERENRLLRYWVIVRAETDTTTPAPE